jgi:hypothetical protein
MNDLQSEILMILCKGWDQGNSNTDAITNRLLEANPELGYIETKINVVEALKELRDRGELQIVTMNWELGEEFFYICTNRID